MLLTDRFEREADGHSNTLLDKNTLEYLISNAQRRCSQRGADFVLMFERQRVTQNLRSVGCRSAAVC